MAERDLGSALRRGPVLEESLSQYFRKKGALEGLQKEYGLTTAGDLLRHYPRRYIEVNELTVLDALPDNENVTLVAEVATARTRMMQRGRSMLNVVVTDGSGQLHLAFFAAVPYHNRRLRPGVRALFTGKVSMYRGQRQLAQPSYELLEDVDEGDEDALRARAARPIPVYPATAAVDSQALGRTVQVILDTMGRLEDPIPAEIRARHGLMDLTTALRAIHRPDDLEQARKAQRRLRFEEAFVMQVALARRRRADHELAAVPRQAAPGGLVTQLDQRLPFNLTSGQHEVSAQIADDLARTWPMHRLLQGEVGSGKTVVALRAMLSVIDGGGQAALLAPTEVLATQHHRSIMGMLGELAEAGMLGGDNRGTRVTLLTGSLSAPARRKALLEAASGEAGIVVGTHALLAERVQFADLGLIVVDEQHRFGVEQRDALRGKAKAAPHLLVMTATPIPRTVAMTVFGDLEISTLRELPAGRSPISTAVVPAANQRWVDRAWQRVQEEAASGHQVFVVCPRIGADDEADDQPAEPSQPADPADPADPAEQAGEAIEPALAEAAEAAEAADQERRPGAAVLEQLARLRELPALAGLAVEALHGRMPADDRDQTMRRFAAGKIDVLVATTVIAVGGDVPNASTMVVLDADRFGVSQLHQLRGRVGRGSVPGLCLLFTEVSEGPAFERLEAIAGTLDGFELARVDLENRREGDVLGNRQSGGRSSLRLLRVLRDEKLIETVRHEATAVVESDGELAGQPALLAALRVWLDEDREAYLERG